MLFGIKILNRYILKLICANINVCPEFTFGRGELKLLNLRQVQLMQQNRLQAELLSVTTNSDTVEVKLTASKTVAGDDISYTGWLYVKSLNF